MFCQNDDMCNECPTTSGPARCFGRFVLDSRVSAYPTEPPFDPPENYPELPFAEKGNTGASVYQMLRELLLSIGLDNKHVGSREWNPFGNLVKPGDHVVIKPNLVTHQHFLGKEALYSSIVHGSVIRPIVDYIYLALKGQGVITIADNPVEGADFDTIMAFTGIKDMVKVLTHRGYRGLRIVDLRPRVLRECQDGTFRHDPQIGDPLGYVSVDLGKDSAFGDLDDKHGMHYYTLADKTIDHLNPKCVRESLTDHFHNSSRHEYVVSKTVLDANVVINVAKMKTHCKAGVSLALKNIIGITYLKECMPHHRPGFPPDGDSFPHYPPAHYTASRRLYRRLREGVQIHRLPGFRSFRNLLQRNRILVGQHVEHGNWKGNDTIWRTILDLNRILLYGDRKGVMTDTQQRRLFCIVDGIVAQQGDGPNSGEPVSSSIIFGGENPVYVDALAIKAMGIDAELIKTVQKATNLEKWKLVADPECDPFSQGLAVPSLAFRLPKGWK